GYRRVLAVIGLESTIKEINAQATVLAEIQAELNLELVRDRSNFALAQTQLVGQAQELAEKLNNARTEVERAHQQAEIQRALVGKRNRDVADAEQDLAEARKVSAERFQQLVDM